MTVKVIEIRLARKGETARQKEIWKLCFGDSDHYIDFFYANRYREDETMLLLQDGEILAMLTMVPVTVTASDQRSFPAAMLYAIATHPTRQHQGLATGLMDCTSQYLRRRGIPFSVLVPSGKPLFNFYGQQGYQEAFYIREASFSRSRIESLSIGETCRCIVAGITPEAFNRRRSQQLCGRFYISYADGEVAYQRRLSQQSGADIYGIDIGEVQGCAVIEKIGANQVLIKELLIPDEFLPVAIKNIAQLLPVQKYTLRTPAFRGQQLGGFIRPFGMMKIHQAIDFEIAPDDLGYLGLAFD